MERFSRIQHFNETHAGKHHVFVWLHCQIISRAFNDSWLITQPILTCCWYMSHIISYQSTTVIDYLICYRYEQRYNFVTGLWGLTQSELRWFSVFELFDETQALPKACWKLSTILAFCFWFATQGKPKRITTLWKKFILVLVIR